MIAMMLGFDYQIQRDKETGNFSGISLMTRK